MLPLEVAICATLDLLKGVGVDKFCVCVLFLLLERVHSLCIRTFILFTLHAIEQRLRKGARNDQSEQKDMSLHLSISKVVC